MRLEFIEKMMAICNNSQRWENRIFHCCLLPHLSTLLPHTSCAFAKSPLKQVIFTRSSISVKRHTVLRFKYETGDMKQALEAVFFSIVSFCCMILVLSVSIIVDFIFFRLAESLLLPFWQVCGNMRPVPGSFRRGCI